MTSQTCPGDFRLTAAILHRTANSIIMTKILRQFYRALGPLAGGIILDTLDIATFGPLGIYFGGFIGFTVGWWITSFYDFGPRMRFAIATLAAIYLTMPLTEILPLATSVSAIARFRGQDPGSGA